MNIAIPIYDRFTALDAVGPYEVLSRLPGATVHFLAKQPGPQRTETRMLLLSADRAFDELPTPEVIVVPGGYGTRQLLSDETILGWLRAAHESSQWTTSVCTGALLLGAAGLLAGRRATTHWLAYHHLRRHGADVTEERVVFDGKVVTAAGVSAGIDLALTLAARLQGPEVAQAIQLGIEYDPQPPYDAGAPSKAPAAVRDAVTEVMAAAEARYAAP